MLRISSSPGRDRAYHHCWISSFWTHSGKKAAVVRKSCLDIRQYLTKGFVYRFNKSGGNVSTVCFFLFVLPPWLETFADARDGDWGGEKGSIFVPSITQYKMFIDFYMIYS